MGVRVEVRTEWRRLSATLTTPTRRSRWHHHIIPSGFVYQGQTVPLKSQRTISLFGQTLVIWRRYPLTAEQQQAWTDHGHLMKCWRI